MMIKYIFYERKNTKHTKNTLSEITKRGKEYSFVAHKFSI